MMKFDLGKHATKGLFSFAAIALYDIFVEGVSYKNSYVLYDGLTFALSNVASGISADVILNLIGYHNDGLIPMITEPLVNAFMYDYLYRKFIKHKSEFGKLHKREGTTNFVLGLSGNVIVKMVQNPLMGLWGFKAY